MALNQDQLRAAINKALEAGIDLKTDAAIAAFMRAANSTATGGDPNKIVQAVRVDLLEDQDQSPRSLYRRGFEQPPQPAPRQPAVTPDETNPWVSIVRGVQNPTSNPLEDE